MPNTFPTNSPSAAASSSAASSLPVTGLTALDQTLAEDVPGMKKSTLVSTTSGTWEEITSYTGSGVLEFLAVRLRLNASSADIGLRLTVDDVVIFSNAIRWTDISDEDETVTFVGAFIYSGTAFEALSLGRLTFNTGWSLEKTQVQVSSTTVDSYESFQST